MASRRPSDQMVTIIDLTLDDIDVPSSNTVDDPRPFDYASQVTGLKVEDESSTLVGSSTADSGESSPNTQRTYDTAQTESNPTDPGDLSPRNSRNEDSDSSDDDLATVLARNRKRENTSGDAQTSEHRPSDTQLAPAALVPVFGVKPLKPAFDELWFNRDRRVNDSSSTKPQHGGNPKTQRDKRVTIQQERPLANTTDPQVLNTDRETVLGPKEKTNERSSKPNTQQKPAKRKSRVDEELPSIPVSRRAVSEGPETYRPKEKVRSSGAVKSSQPHEVLESQRPHKRRKHSRQDDSVSSSNSSAAALENSSSQVAPANKLQSHRPGAHVVERISVTGKDGATNIHRGSSGHRSGGARLHPGDRATTGPERRQKKLMERAWKQSQKAERASSGRSQGYKSSMLAAENERGQWRRSGFQRAEVASQRPPKPKYDRMATPVRDSNHHEAHQRPRGVYSGATGAQLFSESDGDRTEASEQEEDARQDLRTSKLRSQPSQQVRGDYDQRGTRNVRSEADTAQPATRMEQPRQVLSPGAHKKAMEEAKQFFENHPSNTAPQRRVKMTNFMPSDVSKPSFSFRSQMVNASSRKRGGRKLPTLAQQAMKKERDRQRQISAMRQRLEEQAIQLPEGYRQKWVADGLAKQLQRFRKNDEKKEAQKSQGFLTVEDLEDMGDAGSDRINRPHGAAPKGKRHGIPVAEALEPGATMTLYVVYISDPVEKNKVKGGKELSIEDWKRLGDQFLRKEEANKHAEAVLRDERYEDSHLVSIQFRVGPEDGLFFGTKERADGRLVMCMVQKERQLASNLDLGDTFVRKELKEIYCPRFDVFYTNVIPKVFLNKEKTTTDQSEECLEAKSKSNTPLADVGRESDPSEKEHADDDRCSLFSATSTPEPQEAQSEEAGADEVEEEEEAEEGDESDACSDVTLAPSEPGGNVDSLSWNYVQYIHEHVGAFTTMELANQKAYKVALELWQPRGTHIDAWNHYRYGIRPSLEEWKTHELDVEAAELEFEVPEFGGHVDHRPWPFVHSLVYVKETRLEGPRDIGNYVVMGNDEDSGEDGQEDDEDD